jgi:PAS domain-containing protein
MTGKQIHEESRYRTLFEVANDSIFILKDYRFVECNRMALKMFGCERENDVLYSYRKR